MTKRFYDGLDDDIRSILLGQIRNLWTHTSTAIEGNQLSLGDTAFVLEEGMTVSGKSLKDHKEVYDHAKAIDLIYRFLELDKLSEAEIFMLHKSILTEHVTDIYCPVGGWKNEPNYTSFVTKEGKQATREYPSPEHTAKLMGQWLDRFNAVFGKELSQDEATAAYARLHLDFVTIHPFYDGNGRLARLLANLPVLKAGLPPIIVPISEKQSYKETISSYQEGIPNLASLDDLAKLPESARFRDLCAGYWAETMELVENARELQERRDLAPRP